MRRLAPRATLFPYTTLFRSGVSGCWRIGDGVVVAWQKGRQRSVGDGGATAVNGGDQVLFVDRGGDSAAQILIGDFVAVRSEERRVGKEGRSSGSQEMAGENN